MSAMDIATLKAYLQAKGPCPAVLELESITVALGLTNTVDILELISLYSLHSTAQSIRRGVDRDQAPGTTCLFGRLYSQDVWCI